MDTQILCLPDGLASPSHSNNAHAFPLLPEVANKRSLDIRFDDVSFAYPTRSESRVFDSFSLDVPAGRVVALVGHSGAGKIAQLWGYFGVILRLWGVDEAYDLIPFRGQIES
ncbi:unnamed protein product [Protopolystoma xenopodis]|uniref:ABC transporter domain-containing protein n=1 Tax=Protopolystoma xenopodis TaxID=117903 RepID=A0A448X9K4_9PLAT|nr:unnamed protein product [Protopolystoma xenopodis]